MVVVEALALLTDLHENHTNPTSAASSSSFIPETGQARANLLDSMVASSSDTSSQGSGSGSNSGGSGSSSESGDDSFEVQHGRMQEIHRVRRHRRASDRQRGVVRYIPAVRPSILDRKDFYYRFGEKEKEAVASFDFLEDFSSSVSDVGSLEALHRQHHHHHQRPGAAKKVVSRHHHQKQQHHQTDKKEEKNSNKTVGQQRPSAGQITNNNSAGNNLESMERLSLSDSCADKLHLFQCQP